MERRTLLGALAILACTLAPVAAVQAQSFPERPIRLIVPYAPGGAMDGTARLLAQQLQESLKQTVLVENKPGASGMIGVDFMRRSEPDGYTILIDTMAIGVNPTLNNAKYDPIADFTPISQVMAMPYALAVNPNSGIKTLGDLVAKLKANPGKLNSATSGTGSQLATVAFRKESGTKFEIIPYPGGGPGILSVMAGDCEMVIMDMANIAPFITSGKLTGLVVSTPGRSEVTPDVPSAPEVGLPGFEVSAWFGIFGPKGIPADRVTFLNAEIRKALRTDAMVKFFRSTGSIPSTMDAPQFAAFYRKEVDRWRAVILENGLQAKQ
ncbi:Bug family tripartite tricarboxylate transporter substrate binding protein [Xanthobacter tagetidis]|uniref:Tripartite tricarboxylate transporter substrate binding protein n=1 Tax=Xanthobacter tagetidis TaxID=60216 RepID=A0A3L7AJM2_9HYPH|nr:tripartite tricarboxylate transporter substrate binding protein [Xanthobacter tagetidis]MBB6309062.1 tripartite-type tricarboxylate transporter receptor subunit TctC [Xanthobacter tagetidis]RLP80447.1 tripartite tricarboxylate transporter substrate binding protein [Xanthobacter tagetidis]